MAIRRGVFAFPASGLEIYATPRPDLGNWNRKVRCYEAASPNLGLYTYEVDDSVATHWGLFIGASQPTGWDKEIGEIKPRDVILVHPSMGYGEREVAGNTIEIATDAERTITRTVLDSEDNEVDLEASYFVLCDQSGLQVAKLTAFVQGGTYTVTIPRSACRVAQDLLFALRASDESNLDYDSGTLRIVYVANQTEE